MVKGEKYTPFGKRLELLIKELKTRGFKNKEGKMNNDVFAKSLKIDPGQLSGVKTGKYNLTIPQLLEVNSIYGVRLGWLLEGEKPMFKNEKSGTNKMPDRSLLVQLNNELSAAQLSLRKLEESLAFPQEENVNQGAAYQEIPVNKNPIADKQ